MLLPLLDQLKVPQTPYSIPKISNIPRELARNGAPWAPPPDLLNQTWHGNKITTVVHNAAEDLCAHCSWRHAGLRELC